MEQLHRKVDARLNKCPEQREYRCLKLSHRDHVWLHFKTQRGPQAPSIHYQGIAASHLSQNRTEHRGGGGGATHAWLPLPAVPVRQISGSRIDIVKACHHGTWSGSPSCFTTQKIAEKRAYPHGPMHPNMEALTLRPEEKTNSAHTQTFTGDWV